MRYAVTLDSVFTKHQTPEGHPERADRIRAVERRLRSWSGFPRLILSPPETVDPRWLRAIHTPEHLAAVRATADRRHTQLDPDTHAAADSYRIALLAAGSAVRVSCGVAGGEFDRGFVLARPPGHHAESGRAMGFCLLNNAAAATAAALELDGVNRVAVVDFDVHHGNGTQEIFYARPDVLYLSSHQHPLYPGTGRWEERGSGAGRGYTLNLPIPAGKGNGFYLALYRHFVVPALERFQPDLILVSAGFDGHHRDPLAGMNLDEDGFAALAGLLDETAENLCKGRTVYLLEGGYDLDALAESVLQTVRVGVGEKMAKAPAEESAEVREYCREAERRLGL